jgi:uncharacterized UPF0160 family protein
MAETSRPYYQYPLYQKLAARILSDRENKNSNGDYVELNPDYIHTDLVHKLDEVDKLLSAYGGLRGVEYVAIIVQQWEEEQYRNSYFFPKAYHIKNVPS